MCMPEKKKRRETAHVMTTNGETMQDKEQLIDEILDAFDKHFSQFEPLQMQELNCKNYEDFMREMEESNELAKRRAEETLRHYENNTEVDNENATNNFIMYFSR